MTFKKVPKNNLNFLSNFIYIRKQISYRTIFGRLRLVSSYFLKLET